MSEKLKPDVPGRGAWTQRGGLLPLKPGNKNPAGYYRPPHPGERMIGSVWMAGHTGLVVHEAVKALQRLLKVTPDGLLGDETGAGIVAAQKRAGLVRDAIAGPATLRALLTPLIERTAASKGLPVDVLGGICVHESRLDLGAVGVSGWDHGLAQINLGAHTQVTVAQAIDPQFALDFTARDLKAVHDRWVGRTVADPFDIAVAAHNSPAASRAWALHPEGKPPFSQERERNGFPQIDEYVRMARAAWRQT